MITSNITVEVCVWFSIAFTLQKHACVILAMFFPVLPDESNDGYHVVLKWPETAEALQVPLANLHNTGLFLS